MTVLLLQIEQFSHKKMHVKIMSVKYLLFCWSLNYTLYPDPGSDPSLACEQVASLQTH